ncbi:NAD-dependent epimerase/dehydratase family protein [Candidatus Bathyarchaeota archaeon]|nr:MAG: NAD-dependent epimerase/dehydratase family protein [Candidatus Bathyarchaeota archaeon]
MKVMIMGMDGYLGWALSMYLADRGHQVSGIDNMSRRKNVAEIGSQSATPIKSMKERLKAYKKTSGNDLTFYQGDLVEPSFVDLAVKKEIPDCIVHLGEIPSAPYSMIDVQHCNYTQVNNIIGHNNILFAIKDHVPDCHLLKLGTMGEYGTPNVDIPEGFFEIEYRGRKDKLPFPRQPGSWYHLTKVHDTWNLMFANKIWGIRATDVMQGVVHGLNTPQMVNDDLLTRYDFDEVFGTAINRFCAQAVVGHELTPYGKGGQTRGYLALRDSMQCFTIAIENPPKEREYRVFNQFEETYSVNELAERVSKVAQEYGLESKIWNIPNPRIEAEEHYYKPDMVHLPKLGFKPVHTLEEELHITIPKLIEHKNRIEAKRAAIDPKINWNA